MPHPSFHWPAAVLLVVLILIAYSIGYLAMLDLGICALVRQTITLAERLPSYSSTPPIGSIANVSDPINGYTASSLAIATGSNEAE